MSDPARLLQDLHLEEMPVTRSQAPHMQESRIGNVRLGRGRGRGRGRDPPRSPHPAQAHRPQAAPVRSYTGRQYYTQALTPRSAQRANEGLEAHFHVAGVESLDSGREKYYAFQLKTPVAVRIYEPHAGHARVQCSCEAFRMTQTECVHVFWLFVGLHSVLTDQQAADVQRPTDIESPLTSQLGELYPLMEQRQPSLHQKLNDIRDDDADYEVDDTTMQEISAIIDTDTRTEILCDILSSFDASQIPEEFKHRFVDYPSSELTPLNEDVYVPGSLPATMYHLASRDYSLHRRLQKVVSRDARASQYFETQFNRAKAHLQQFSRSVEMASIPRRQTETEHVIDVPSCGNTVRSIVDQICRSRDARTAFAPLGADVLRRLAEMLVKLMAQVVTLDRDLDGIASQGRVEPASEHPRQRNLFSYLIGDPPSDPTMPHWMSDAFVIDRLRGFPSSEWSHLLELLTTIKDGIEEKDMDAFPGSFAYAAKIDDMLHDYTATADEPSSSSAQMPRRT